MLRKDVDDIVRDALRNHKPEYKPEFWEAMEQALDAAEEKSSNRRPILVLMTMLVVAGSALGVLFIKDGAVMQESGLQQKTSQYTAANDNDKNNHNYLAAKRKLTTSPEKTAAGSGSITDKISGKTGSGTTANNDQNIIESSGKENVTAEAAISGKADELLADHKNTDITHKTKTKYKAKRNYTKEGRNLAGGQAFNKNAETRYSSENNAKTGLKTASAEITKAENSVLRNNNNSINTNTNNDAVAVNTDPAKNENSASEIELKEIPLSLAENNSAKAFTEIEQRSDSVPDGGGKPSSMALKAEGDKNNNNGASVNWQSVMFHFRENAAYTGNEARFNFNTDTRHTIYEGLGSLESRYNFSFDTRIDKLRTSIGVYHQRSARQLSFTRTNGISIAHHIKTDPGGELRIGAGLVQHNRWLYINSFKYNDQIMPGYGFLFPSDDNDISPKTTDYSADAGVWYQRKKWMAGFSAKNIYSTRPVNYEMPAAPAEYILSGGYRFDLGKNMQLMPWVEAHHYAPLYWFHSSLMLSWKDKFMLGSFYQNINPEVGYGDVGLFAGVNIKSRLRIHASMGRSSEWMYSGIKQDILQAGIRYQIK